MISLLVTRPAPMTLPDIYSKKEVNRNGNTIKVKDKLLFKAVILKPGPNRDVLSAEHWAAVQKQCEKYLKAKTLVVIDSDEEVPEKFDPDAQIKHVTIEEATVAIAEESDLERLQAWHLKDERPEVQKAIEARLVELAEAENNN